MNRLLNIYNIIKNRGCITWEETSKLFPDKNKTSANIATLVNNGYIFSYNGVYRANRSICHNSDLTEIADDYVDNMDKYYHHRLDFYIKKIPKSLIGNLSITDAIYIMYNNGIKNQSVQDIMDITKTKEWTVKTILNMMEVCGMSRKIGDNIYHIMQINPKIKGSDIRKAYSAIRMAQDRENGCLIKEEDYEIVVEPVEETEEEKAEREARELEEFKLSMRKRASRLAREYKNATEEEKEYIAGALYSSMLWAEGLTK